MDEIKPVGKVSNGVFDYFTPRHGLHNGSLLYPQSAIDFLMQQLVRMQMCVDLVHESWENYGPQKALVAELGEMRRAMAGEFKRAERAEAEVERLKEVCDKWSERELLFGAHEDLQARAERAEAEAETLRKDAEGRWDEWLSHALSKWPEAEAALIATRVALGPTAPITQADIDFAKREAL